MREIFLEAESFDHLGGWVVDTTSMESIHSAYFVFTLARSRADGEAENRTL